MASDANRLGAVAQLRRLFWDKPLEESDLEQYPYWAPLRVLDYGQLSDVRAAMALYGREAFYRMVAKVRFSTPKAENFWRQMLEMEGIPCERKPFPLGSEEHCPGRRGPTLKASAPTTDTREGEGQGTTSRP